MWSRIIWAFSSVALAEDGVSFAGSEDGVAFGGSCVTGGVSACASNQAQDAAIAAPMWSDFMPLLSALQARGLLLGPTPGPTRRTDLPMGVSTPATLLSQRSGPRRAPSSRHENSTSARLG